MSACPGCGLELLAREYGELRYPPSHRITVDVYAVQHPGEPERRSIQSVAVHLIALCLVLERDVATVKVRELMSRVLAVSPASPAGAP
jgi:hypothetical protein